MRLQTCVILAATMLPSVAGAQSPVAEAFRQNVADVGRNLIVAAERMPADKYDFKPTPAQMTFGDIVNHLSNGNDFLCGAITGVSAPMRDAVSVSHGKDALVKRLRETFQFCNETLSHLDDSRLSEQLKVFGKTMSRAALETLTTGDWADHYSQAAIYLRLNGLLPPTAQK